jgi:hypothetical protein
MGDNNEGEREGDNDDDDDQPLASQSPGHTTATTTQEMTRRSTRIASHRSVTVDRFSPINPRPRSNKAPSERYITTPVQPPSITNIWVTTPNLYRMIHDGITIGNRCLTDRISSMLANARFIHLDIDITNLSAQQCNHPDLESYQRTTASRLTTIADEVVFVYTRNGNDYRLLMIVAQGRYGIGEGDNATFLEYLRSWARSKHSPPLMRGNNSRYRLARPVTSRNNHRLYNGGVWIPRASTTRFPQATADQRDTRAIPFIRFLEMYQQHGVAEMFGALRYLIDADAYNTSLRLYQALPPSCQQYVNDIDGATTHVLNFLWYADCHSDGCNGNTTAQITYGNYWDVFLCFPNIGIKIDLRPGGYLAFADKSLEHFTYDGSEGYNDTHYTERYVHTTHTPATVLSSYSSNTNNWVRLAQLTQLLTRDLFDALDTFTTRSV